MKINNRIFSLLAGAAVLMGVASCNNEEFLTVDHYSILALDQGYGNDNQALSSLTGCYDLMLPEDNADLGYNGDPFKPYIFTGCHPTMDTQATGWDKNFMTQSWTSTTTELQSGWNQAYGGISRCNDFLFNLESAENVSADLKKTMEGEARTIRAFQYFWLATTFGRVPMLETGETYASTPYKARAESYAEMWDFIIADLETAADLLSWKPYNSQYGRCTKGMALAYLGDAYMWKAYRCPDVAKDCYTKAAAALKQVLECGEYELNKSYTTLYDITNVWGKEAIFEQVLDEGDKWSSWDSNAMTGAHGWTIYYSAAPANGGWGTIALSWELYDSFEQGDRRRDGSMVAAAIPTAKLEKAEWASSYAPQDEWLAVESNAKLYYEEDGVTPKSLTGYNPFVQEYLNVKNYKCDTGGEYAPAVYTMKYWRLGRCHWNSDQWAPAQVYRKRLPNVMLDYAECLFNLNGGDDATAWAQINTLRERAFGNLEVGVDFSSFLSYYNLQMAPFYAGKDAGFGEYVTSTRYPVPFADAVVTVPDAKTYYTSLKASKGFSSEVWKVALNSERRKEFSCEWCLCPDMIKSGFMADHIEHNYPKHAQQADPLSDWQSVRTFEYDDAKMDMPIPADELIKNPLCDQNEPYK